MPRFEIAQSNKTICENCHQPIEYGNIRYTS